MTPKIARCLGAIGMVASLASGCTVGPDSSFTDYQPLVFPDGGFLGGSGWGSTAAVVLDSNYFDLGYGGGCGSPPQPPPEAASENYELYDLHAGRINIFLAFPWVPPPGGGCGGGTGMPDNAFSDAPVNIRSVFSIGATRNSQLAQQAPGAELTVVVFDLPPRSVVNAPAGFSYPFTALLRVEIDGLPYFEPRITIWGDNGSPNAVVDALILSLKGISPDALEPRPTLRLRGKRGAGKFLASQGVLSAVEFDFLYDTSCIAAVRGFPATEAANGTVVVGPAAPAGGGFDTAHVMMLVPEGFSLTFQNDEGDGNLIDETLAGHGPFLDLALDYAPGASCSLLDTSVFGIQNLSVVDLNGSSVLSRSGSVPMDSVAEPLSEAVLRFYPVDVPPS